MTPYPILRVIAPILKIIAAFALLATALVVLAIVGGGISSPPGFPAWIVWLATLAGAAIVALAGLLLALLLYVSAEIVAVLLAAEQQLRISVARLGGPRERA